MTLENLQENIDAWIQKHGVRYFDEMTNLAILTEEVGEVAKIMARTYGEQSVKPGSELNSLSDELADVIFVVTCIANQTGVDLTAAMERNLEKKTKRDHQRHKDNDKLK